MESSLTIKDVSQRTGLSAHTLRYYERIGLIAPVARATGGQRRYADPVVLVNEILTADHVLRLRTTGMPIQGMLEFARLRSEGNVTARTRRKILESHLADVLSNIASLQQSAEALQTKIGIYRQIEHSFSQDSQLVEGKTNDSKSL